jgi:hypothetical protein
VIFEQTNLKTNPTTKLQTDAITILAINPDQKTGSKKSKIEKIYHTNFPDINSFRETKLS